MKWTILLDIIGDVARKALAAWSGYLVAHLGVTEAHAAAFNDYIVASIPIAASFLWGRFVKTRLWADVKIQIGNSLLSSATPTLSNSKNQ